MGQDDVFPGASKSADGLVFDSVYRATVAQLVEHLTRNEDVRGSIPRGGSMSIKRLGHIPFLPPREKSPKSLHFV